jgi:hypothetical protein
MEGAEPAKVECLSCHGQHNYRAALPGTKKPKAATAPKVPKSPRAPRAKKASGPTVPEINPLEALLASRPPSDPRAYSPADRFAVGDVMSHPSFGLGAVTGAPSPGKISVLFHDATRLLLHERSPVVGGAARLQPPPRREEAPVSDAARPSKVKSVL